ncbi:MAG: hypothetical protein EA415_03740 [Sphaerobacteraceae bacterium]|nr:MAG: hypothetical protein EA415_03740 [Sphaerobacteraceae bacterium]
MHNYNLGLTSDEDQGDYLVGARHLTDAPAIAYHQEIITQSRERFILATFRQRGPEIQPG